MSIEIDTLATDLDKNKKVIQWRKDNLSLNSARIVLYSFATK